MFQHADRACAGFWHATFGAATSDAWWAGGRAVAGQR
jgi:hypothetical protein